MSQTNAKQPCEFLPAMTGNQQKLLGNYRSVSGIPFLYLQVAQRQECTRIPFLPHPQRVPPTRRAPHAIGGLGKRLFPDVLPVPFTHSGGKGSKKTNGLCNRGGRREWR